MKVFLQPGLRALSGGMGDWVYQLRNGKTILGMKPLNTKEPSQAQMDQRARFKKAAAYAKFALADEATRRIYEAAAEEKGIPAFALCVADFLKGPAIEEVDTSAYNGHDGSPIGILTSDDVGVVNVHVTITDGNGTTIESGNAVESVIGTGHWSYMATASIAPGIPVNINVVATDRPGGTAVQSIPYTIP